MSELLAKIAIDSKRAPCYTLEHAPVLRPDQARVQEASRRRWNEEPEAPAARVDESPGSPGGEVQTRGGGAVKLEVWMREARRLCRLLANGDYDIVQAERGPVEVSHAEVRQSVVVAPGQGAIVWRASCPVVAVTALTPDEAMKGVLVKLRKEAADRIERARKEQAALQAAVEPPLRLVRDRDDT